jgi:hypothetical protein
MLDFDLKPVGSAKAATTTTVIVTEAPVVVETVTVTRTPDRSAGYLTKSDAEWGWEDLRDFVIHEIEARHGVQVRDFRKESGIFKSFLSRYGSNAVPIARLAFSKVFDGMWSSAPITVTRFCKASDPYFADILAKRL